MTISTLVLIVLGVLVLTSLVLALTIGFENFWTTLKSYFISDVEATRGACENSCVSGLEYDYCCRQRELDFNTGKGKEKITCQDERLNIECDINCEGVC